MRYAPLLGTLVALAILPAPAGAQRRIIGGEPAGIYPAQAEVDVRMNGHDNVCGGTVIHREWVLTAAHCVTSDAGRQVRPRKVAVRLGSNLLGHGRRYVVNVLVRDPTFQRQTFVDDAALLHLRRPAAHAVPLPLVTGAPVSTTARVLGWGTLAEGGPPSPTLRQVDVPIEPDGLCSVLYGADFVAPAMLCAGYAQGGRDACQGDSGGPIMVGGEANWSLAGIVSAGKGCARAGRPGIYTDLTEPALRGWISATAVHLGRH